jgi:hypothetical protein
MCGSQSARRRKKIFNLFACMLDHEALTMLGVVWASGEGQLASGGNLYGRLAGSVKIF